MAGLLALAWLSSSVSLGEEAGEPAFGEALYYAYQGQWFEALEQLDAALRESVGSDGALPDELWYQSVDANFSVGDFELNYRLHHHAAQLILAAMEETPGEPFHDHAAYRLARLHFRKGQYHDALRALDSVSEDMPDEIRDDVAFLRASVYLSLEWSEPAIPVLQELLKSREYGAFAAYNLGIAYLQGDLVNAAYDQLDRAGKLRARNDADAAIRDKANLVLGTLLYEEGQYTRAIVYLNRVRLDGPFSNRALLSAGWANMSAGRPKRAIVSWSTLAERDATDRATQEGLLALPYAFSQLELPEQAASHYGRALNAYAAQLEKLDQSIRSIQAGRFLDALLLDERNEDEDWVIRLRALPDTPETYYLMELLASNDFQTGLQNYLDLADLKRRLSRWSASLAAYAELVAARETHFESLLPEIDKQFLALDTRLERQLERYAALLQQLGRMRPPPEAQAQNPAHLAELDRSLQSLDDAIVHAQTRYDRFLNARQTATDSYAGYDDSLDQLSDHMTEALTRVENLMTRQGQLLEKLATDELTARLRRLDAYASKARFGLADSKDRMQRKGLAE